MRLLRSPLVRALEPDVLAVLAEVAKRHGWPHAGDVRALGARVKALSDGYNARGASALRGAGPLAARLSFSFVRDVPKGAAAVRELVGSGALALPDGGLLEVLDVGAGLGATSRGVVRALAAAGGKGTVRVEALDDDPDALAVAAEIARARPKEGEVSIELAARRGDAAGTRARATFDVVLAGQVLSELDMGLAPEARTARHAELVLHLAASVREGGSLVLVEPALKDRTRHLHAVRDAVLARGGLHVFAPCVHDAPCPALLDEGAWCHEDLGVDLPPELVPVARAAGLRWEGLTFSYVVFRKDGERYTGGRGWRVVSAPIVSKGKRELFLCGASGAGAERVRAMRLDRHAAEGNAAWDDAARGDVLGVELDGKRVRQDARVEKLGGGRVG